MGTVGARLDIDFVVGVGDHFYPSGLHGGVGDERSLPLPCLPFE